MLYAIHAFMKTELGTTSTMVTFTSLGKPVLFAFNFKLDCHQQFVLGKLPVVWELPASRRHQQLLKLYEKFFKERKAGAIQWALSVWRKRLSRIHCHSRYGVSLYTYLMKQIRENWGPISFFLKEIWYPVNQNWEESKEDTPPNESTRIVKAQFYRYFRKYVNNFLIISILSMYNSTDLN